MVTVKATQLRLFSHLKMFPRVFEGDNDGAKPGVKRVVLRNDISDEDFRHDGDEAGQVTVVAAQHVRVVRFHLGGGGRQKELDRERKFFMVPAQHVRVVQFHLGEVAIGEEGVRVR